jgi:2-haloacid dehalogenase
MTQHIPDISVCVFDAYGTLFDVHSAAARLRPSLGDKADQLSEIWRQKQLEYTWLRSLMGRYDDFWQVTSDALGYAMVAVGMTDPALRAQLMQLYLTLAPYPEVKPTLERLKTAKMQTAILSNGTQTMLVAAAKNAEVYPLLDHILSVEPLATYKPSPAVYQLAVDKLGVPPARICYLSANAWDAAGAAAFGFRVVWVNRFRQPPEALPGDPVATVNTLSELPTLVGA